jgi:hypothetical protein
VRRSPTLLATGWAGLVGNVVAVAFLADQPAAYRPKQLDAWAAQVAAHPAAASASAVAFTLGLVSLGLWATELRSHLPTRAARAGALLVGIGALFDALGTVAPLVLALHVGAEPNGAGAAVSRALLGLALSLDALFNVSLGVGLIALGAGWKGGAGWLRALALAAGLASLPVGGQVVSEQAANLLLLAAPLWIAFVACTTFVAWPAAADPADRRPA